MHGPAVGVGAHGLGVTPSVTLAYAVLAAFLYGCARMAASERVAPGIKGAPAAHPAE